MNFQRQRDVEGGMMSTEQALSTPEDLWLLGKVLHCGHCRGVRTCAQPGANRKKYLDLCSHRL